MANANLRPMATACNLLMRTVVDKEGLDREAKQREWIWEFLLRHEVDGRVLVDLMNALQFPEDNLGLKRLLLLRCLSFQLSSGAFDELTLDLLKALETVCDELGRSHACSADMREAKSDCIQLHRQKQDGNSDWRLEEEAFRSECLPEQVEGRLWYMQLAVMLELTVKHLRGVRLCTTSFEEALGKYWSDFAVDTEVPVTDRLEFNKKREEMKAELWKVRNDLNYLDSLTEKYSEDKVKAMLQSFLKIALQERQESFLDGVSKDIVSGLYEPVNPDLFRSNMKSKYVHDEGLCDPMDPTRQRSNSRPFRGKFSVSRDKLRKVSRVFEIHARREVDEGGSPEINLVLDGKNRRSEEAGDACTIRNILSSSLLQARTTGESSEGVTGVGHSSEGRERRILASEKVANTGLQNEMRDSGERGRTTDGNGEVAGRGVREFQNLRRSARTAAGQGENPGNRSKLPRISPGRKTKAPQRIDTEIADPEIIDISSPSPQPIAQRQGYSSPSGAKRSDPTDVAAGQKVDVQSPLPKMQRTAANPSKYMERNATARTMEWEDDDISASTPSPSRPSFASRGRKSRLVAVHKKSPSQSKTNRRKPRKWSEEETEVLKTEVYRYGKGRWKLIMINNPQVFHGRTEVDLKDKWRNLERFEGLSAN